jgi:hypothetical protein
MMPKNLELPLDTTVDTHRSNQHISESHTPLVNCK